MSLFNNNPTTPVKAGEGNAPGTEPYIAKGFKQIRFIEDIYDPDKPKDPNDTKRYVVPQEGELVVDTPNKLWWYVQHVDIHGATLKSTLIPFMFENGTNDDPGLPFGLPGGYNNGEYVMAVDYSQRPPVVRVDTRAACAGTPAYALVYFGNAFTPENIISVNYNATGQIIDNRVPVELALIDNALNKSVYVTSQFSVILNKEALPDGSRCYLVYYDADGNMIPNVKILGVQHSAFLFDHSIGKKYIKSVELISPWFTNSNEPDTLYIPINMDLITIEFRAMVTYNNGDSKEVLVDGIKARLDGINAYTPTSPMMQGNLVLQYFLDPDEDAWQALPGIPKHVQHNYIIQPTPFNGSYGPRLYAYPYWDTTWKLRIYYGDLDRNFMIDVTDKVMLNDQSDVFDGNKLGTEQQMIFNLRLKDAVPSYSPWIFKQYIGVTLFKTLTDPGRKWQIRYSTLTPPYQNPVAVTVNNGANTTVNLTNGCADVNAWLNLMYYSVTPPYFPGNETVAPIPTHIDLIYVSGEKWRLSVADWNKENTISRELLNGQTLYINWVKVNPDNSELQLANTAVAVEVN